MGEIADLNVAATDVLVQCQALAVNFVETQVRSGSCPTPRAFPFVIGSYLIRPALPAQRKPAALLLAPPELLIWQRLRERSTASGTRKRA